MSLTHNATLKHLTADTKFGDAIRKVYDVDLSMDTSTIEKKIKDFNSNPLDSDGYLVLI